MMEEECLTLEVLRSSLEVERDHDLGGSSVRYGGILEEPIRPGLTLEGLRRRAMAYAMDLIGSTILPEDPEAIPRVLKGLEDATTYSAILARCKELEADQQPLEGRKRSEPTVSVALFETHVKALKEYETVGSESTRTTLVRMLEYIPEGNISLGKEVLSAVAEALKILQTFPYEIVKRQVDLAVKMTRNSPIGHEMLALQDMIDSPTRWLEASVTFVSEVGRIVADIGACSAEYGKTVKELPSAVAAIVTLSKTLDRLAIQILPHAAFKVLSDRLQVYMKETRWMADPRQWSMLRELVKAIKDKASSESEAGVTNLCDQALSCLQGSPMQVVLQQTRLIGNLTRQEEAFHALRPDAEYLDMLSHNPSIWLRPQNRFLDVVQSTIKKFGPRVANVLAGVPDMVVRLVKLRETLLHIDMLTMAASTSLLAGMKESSIRREAAVYLDSLSVLTPCRYLVKPFIRQFEWLKDDDKSAFFQRELESIWKQMHKSIVQIPFDRFDIGHETKVLIFKALEILNASPYQVLVDAMQDRGLMGWEETLSSWLESPSCGSIDPWQDPRVAVLLESLMTLHHLVEEIYSRLSSRDLMTTATTGGKQKLTAVLRHLQPFVGTAVWIRDNQQTYLLLQILNDVVRYRRAECLMAVKTPRACGDFRRRVEDAIRQLDRSTRDLSKECLAYAHCSFLVDRLIYFLKSKEGYPLHYIAEVINTFVPECVELSMAMLVKIKQDRDTPVKRVRRAPPPLPLYNRTGTIFAYLTTRVCVTPRIIKGKDGSAYKSSIPFMSWRTSMYFVMSLMELVRVTHPDMRQVILYLGLISSLKGDVSAHRPSIVALACILLVAPKPVKGVGADAVRLVASTQEEEKECRWVARAIVETLHRATNVLDFAEVVLPRVRVLKESSRDGLLALLRLGWL